MLRTSWAVTLVSTVVMLVGILVVTRDLAVTNDVFKQGVVEAEKVDATTDKALKAGTELPAAETALKQSLPNVAGTIQVLNQSRGTLATLGEQLNVLAAVLKRADAPLAAVIGSVDQAAGSGRKASGSAKQVVGTLNAGAANIRRLEPLLGETLTRSKRIAAKLRTLQNVPAE